MPEMTAGDVLAVLHALRTAGLRVHVGGGWGIDALLGEQTRPHNDLDLSIDAQHDARVIQILEAAGFLIGEDQRPTRLVMRDPAGHEVDVHPVVFDASGAGVQVAFDGELHYPANGFTTGTIGGETVGCLSVELQVRFHSGYAPSDKDRQDMQWLAERFDARLPAAYD
jgi:lincosamide nucleotidyltransferase A/C/D/E